MTTRTAPVLVPTLHASLSRAMRTRQRMAATGERLNGSAYVDVVARYRRGALGYEASYAADARHLLGAR